MLASYLVSEKIIKVVKNDNLERAREYIESNLSGNLSIEHISKATNISRSVLYRNFSYHHGMTVSEYINLKRVNEAVGLLIKTDLSIDEIAQAVGFASATYFVSVFKRLKGLTPLQFRKQKFLTVEK
jgi:AraC-like DNA-binding protein